MRAADKIGKGLIEALLALGYLNPDMSTKTEAEGTIDPHIESAVAAFMEEKMNSDQFVALAFAASALSKSLGRGSKEGELAHQLACALHWAVHEFSNDPEDELKRKMRDLRLRMQPKQPNVSFVVNPNMAGIPEDASPEEITRILSERASAACGHPVLVSQVPEEVLRDPAKLREFTEQQKAKLLEMEAAKGVVSVAGKEDQATQVERRNEPRDKDPLRKKVEQEFDMDLAHGPKGKLN